MGGGAHGDHGRQGELDQQQAERPQEGTLLVESEVTSGGRWLLGLSVAAREVGSGLQKRGDIILMLFGGEADNSRLSQQRYRGPALGFTIQWRTMLCAGRMAR